MDRAVRVCVDAGIPLGDALQMATATPASVLGEPGVLAPGAPADLVVLDPGLHAIATMVAGGGRAQARNDPRTPSGGPATAPA